MPVLSMQPCNLGSGSLCRRDSRLALVDDAAICMDLSDGAMRVHAIRQGRREQPEALAAAQ